MTGPVLPTRNVVASVSDQNLQMVKWFEDTTTTVSNLVEGAAVSGGFLLDDGTASTDGGFLVDDGGA